MAARRRRSTAAWAKPGCRRSPSRVGGLPKAPIAIVWSPLPAGSPTVPHNRPRHFYPGSKWVDWVGTDFYASYPEWKALSGLYKRYAGEKPFALTEWGVEAGDDPRFVGKLFAWVRKHPRCKMLVYYQDFGSTSSYRIQNYSASLAVLRGPAALRAFPVLRAGCPAPTAAPSGRPVARLSPRFHRPPVRFSIWD